VSPGQTFF